MKLDFQLIPIAAGFEADDEGVGAGGCRGAAEGAVGAEGHAGGQGAFADGPGFVSRAADDAEGVACVGLVERGFGQGAADGDFRPDVAGEAEAGITSDPDWLRGS